MKRRSTLLLALLLLGGAAWLLLAGGEEAGDSALDDTAIEDGRAEGDLLKADARKGEASAPAPVLAGRAPRDELPDRGPVRVRVRGAGGVPLPGVTVHLVPTEGANVAKPLQSLAADAQGSVVFSDAPYDGSVSARVDATNPDGKYVFVLVRDGVVQAIAPNQPSSLLHAPVEQPELMLQPATGLPLHVRIESSVRGRALPGVSWGVMPRFHTPAFDEWRKGGQAGYPLPVAHGRDTTVKFTLAGDLDAHMATDKHHYKVRVHPGARSLDAVLPLRPMARILVLFDPPEGTEDRLWRPKKLYLGTWSEAHVTGDAHQRYLVKGVPHIPGEPIEISGLLGTWKITAKGRMPVDAEETLVLHAQAKKVHIVKSQATAKITYTNGIALTSGSVKFDITAIEPIELDLYKPAEKALPRKFDVAVVDGSGRPVERAVVYIGTHGSSTDKKGIARFENLVPGTHVLKVWGTGPSWQDEVTVPEGSGAIRVTARVPGTVRLRVVDAEGNPMPYAKVEVQQPSVLAWSDVVDGVQRISPFTDHRGRRTLYNLETGNVLIKVSLGTRSAKKLIKVRPGQVTTARIVLE